MGKRAGSNVHNTKEEDIVNRIEHARLCPSVERVGLQVADFPRRWLPFAPFMS